MNVYLDTSSLAKLYIEEEGSESVRSAVREGDMIATSLLSYVEMGSAVYRRLREKRLSKGEANRVLDVFESDWERFGKVSIDAALLKRTHKLLKNHPLRAADAVQLASALYFQEVLEEPVLFYSADRSLLKAARQEKLNIDR
jgi:predicted nucleic acid-binding protein